MTIGILTAMQREQQQIAALLDNQHTDSHLANYTVGSLGQHTIVLVQSGIGKVNAAIAATQLISHYQPDCVISTGCAGGADTSLHLRDIVVSSQLCYHDVYCGEAVGTTTLGQVQGLPARFEGDPRLLQVATTLKADTPIVPGLIVTGDWFVDNKQKMADIVSHFPDAVAVDMESAAIAQACHLHHVPFLSFRVVSDIPLNDDHAAQYHDFWTNVADQSFHTTRLFLEQL